MHVIATRWKWNRGLAAVTTALVGTLGWSHVARADAVTDWHKIAENTLCSGPATPPRSGPVGLIDMAIVQAAVYDAVQNIGGKYKPYHVTIPGASGSPEVAAAKAAHDVLVAFYAPKAEELGKTYKEYLAAKGLKEDDPGVAVGAKAAAGIIAARAEDGRVPTTTPVAWMGEASFGKWRSIDSGRSPASAGMAAPWLGQVKPFVIKSSSEFQPNKPPPAWTSAEYAKDYNEVKAVGAKTNSTRTPEQTASADFFSTDNPNACRVVQGAIREPVAAHVKDISESARAITLASLSIADAVITVWNTKRHDHTWRPITAIHEASKDSNPATEPDPSWQPYLNTPPYSDWTSGANGISGAVTRAYTNYFGKDECPFTVSNGKEERSYKSFSEYAKFVEDVRIWQGIHFRFADVAGREQGEKVADYVFKNVATPK
jgi:hypothetical protein